MLKALRVVKRYQIDKKTMAGITSFRCSSSDSTIKPKAVIFDMGGVVLPAPFEMFKGTRTLITCQSSIVSQIFSFLLIIGQLCLFIYGNYH